MMKSYTAVAAFLCLLASLSLNAWSSEPTKDSLQTVRKNIAEKHAVLVDVREKAEWDNGHIEGAIFLPLSKLKENAEPATLAKLLPKDKIVYTHCVVGIRSISAANILEELGYQVRPLKQGYKELVAAGFKKDESHP